MKFALFLLLAIVVGGLTYIRLAPSYSDRWHIDPVLAKDPGKGGILIAPGVITSALSPEELLGEFDDVVRAEIGVKILAGSVAEGHFTYILRSKLMGFPDFLTVQALPHETGSTLAFCRGCGLGNRISGSITSGCSACWTGCRTVF